VWLQVLRSYTGASLTRPTDKLVALAGLARRFQETYPEALRPETYFAGLCRSGTICQLLWYAAVSVAPVPLYRAPSWSWAAIDGHVDYDFRPSQVNQMLSSVVDVSVSAIVDEYGPVDDGYITIHGPLFLGKITEEPKPEMNSARGLEIKGIDDRDKSPHVWFDSRSTKCTLVDDSSELVLAPLRRGDSALVEGLVLTTFSDRACSAGLLNRVGMFHST